MESEYQTLVVSIGEIIDTYKIIENLGKYRDYEKFLAINTKWKFLADIRVYYKSPKTFKKAKSETDYMTIANTIDLNHRYCLKFLQKIEDKGLQYLIFEHSGPTLEEQLSYMNGITFKFGTVRVIMWQLLHAIELIHEAKIICGTLSTSNISLLGDYVDENGYEKKSGERKIYYIRAEGMIGDDGEATVDGIHFTDLGAMRYVDHVLPTIRKALKHN
jgi:serine/threonine protein kinase